MTFIQVIVGGLLLGAVYALFSSGLTLIWGMMNVINFAHGEFVMIGMYLAFLIVTYLHGGPLAFGPAAAAFLFLLGIVVYYSLIRHVIRGPMLAQILSTFGLALFLRYLAFFIFTANFKTLPEDLLPGVLNVGGILIGVPQFVAGIVAIVLTVGLHLLLTRTAVGSQLLAVAEDREAAMLMGIRPDRMQAIAWGLSGAGAGIAGALIATFYYISPTVGEFLVLTGFVVVALGGFGSVPGALFAGLVVGVIQSLSAFKFGPVYKDVAVYALFVAILWVRPEGLFGEGWRMRWLGIVVAAAFLLCPWLVTDDYYARIGADVLLAAIGASAWNILGGYAGQVSVGHAMFFGIGAYLPLLAYFHLGLPPVAGVPLAIVISLGFAVVVGLPTFRLHGHYFSMATIAVAELVRIVISNLDFVGAATGLMGPAVSRTWLDLSFRSPIPYYYLFLAVLVCLLLLTWHLQRSRMGYYWRAIRAGERPARSLGVPVARYKLYALLLSAAFTSLAGSLYSLMVGFIDPESGFGILRSVEMIIIAALGGAGTLFGPLLGAVILIPLQTVTNSLFGGGGSGLTYIIYGGIIVVLARFEPGGLVDLWRRASLWWSRRRETVAVRHAA